MIKSGLGIETQLLENNPERLQELSEKISNLTPFDNATRKDNFGLYDSFPEIIKVNNDMIILGGCEFNVKFKDDGTLDIINQFGNNFLKLNEPYGNNYFEYYITYIKGKPYKFSINPSILSFNKFHDYIDDERNISDYFLDPGIKYYYKEPSYPGRNYNIETLRQITGLGYTINGEEILLLESVDDDEQLNGLKIVKGIKINDGDNLERKNNTYIENKRKVYLVFNGLCVELNDFQILGTNCLKSKSGKFLIGITPYRISLLNNFFEKAKKLLIEYGLLKFEDYSIGKKLQVTEKIQSIIGK